MWIKEYILYYALETLSQLMSLLLFQAKRAGKTKVEEPGFIVRMKYEILGYFQFFDDTINKIDESVMISEYHVIISFWMSLFTKKNICVTQNII